MLTFQQTSFHGPKRALSFTSVFMIRSTISHAPRMRRSPTPTVQKIFFASLAASGLPLAVMYFHPAYAKSMADRKTATYMPALMTFCASCAIWQKLHAGNDTPFTTHACAPQHGTMVGIVCANAMAGETRRRRSARETATEDSFIAGALNMQHIVALN